MLRPTSSSSGIRQLRLSVVRDLPHMRYSLSAGIVATQKPHSTREIHVLPEETEPSSRLIRRSCCVRHSSISSRCFFV